MFGTATETSRSRVVVCVIPSARLEEEWSSMVWAVLTVETSRYELEARPTKMCLGRIFWEYLAPF